MGGNSQIGDTERMRGKEKKRLTTEDGKGRFFVAFVPKVFFFLNPFILRLGPWGAM